MWIKAIAVLAASAGLVSAGAARGADGVIQINQAKATATGGFPFTISSSGSYLLTGNLTVSAEDTSGILVNANDVTIDLNGFAITGPYSCSGDGGSISCTPTPNGISKGAIEAGLGNSRITVRDGFVRGFPKGVYLARDSRIENVTVTEMFYNGIFVYARSSVVRCLSNRNGSNGISSAGNVTDGVLISENVTQDNGADGIAVGLEGTVRGNVATGNGGNGINGGSAVVGNTSRSNGGDGIVGSGLIAHNYVSGNTDDEIETIGTGSHLVVGNTVSSSSPTGSALNLAAQTSFIDNAIKGLVSGGIDVSGNRCNGVTCP